MKKVVWIIIVLAVMTSGCAAPKKTIPDNPVQALNGRAQETSDDEFDLLEDELVQNDVKIDDPLEPLNRTIYNVNDRLYFWLLKPVTKIYINITPKFARIGIRNFFQNLTTPARFVNCHLQGKKAVADIELKRFLINTTEGVLGFGDPAKDRHDLKPSEKEDMGQTLASHGFDNGCYVVLPLLGPSTLRDSAGMVGDLLMNPVFYVQPDETAFRISAVNITNESSFHVGQYEDFKAASLDPYVAMRKAYIQYRNEQIKN